MRAFLALIVVIAAERAATAGPYDATFAKAFGVSTSQIHDVVEFQLPAGNEMTHVVVGRYDHGKYVMAGAVMMKCNASECAWRRADFGAADSIEMHGVVDLHGAPAPIPNRPLSRGSKVAGPRGMKFPALVIRTRESKRAIGETRSRKEVEGTETRVKLYVISLVDADRASVVLMDTAEERSPTGRGFVRSYRLDKGDAKGTLDIIAKEQRKLDRDSRCLAPEPSETVWALEDRHYRTKSVDPPRRGC